MNPNDPAYPIISPVGIPLSFNCGLSKREYFAAFAMQALLSDTGLRSGTPKEIAETAVMVANALIRELDEQEGSR